jgi:hypothetical protein
VAPHLNSTALECSGDVSSLLLTNSKPQL